MMYKSIITIFYSQRRAVCVGLRVKVRFIKKANNIHGRSHRKIKWYGGVICGTANGRRVIKIHYDDGTSEVANFPDKDIIVDDVNNGRHGGNGSGSGGNCGGEFVPIPSVPNEHMALSASVEGEEKEGERGHKVTEKERNDDTSERKRQKRSSDLDEDVGDDSIALEKCQIKSKQSDEKEEEKSDERTTTLFLPDVLVRTKKSLNNEDGVSKIGRVSMAQEEITTTLHKEYHGGCKMIIRSETEEEEGEEGEDGEIVESRILVPSSGQQEKRPWSNKDEILPVYELSECLPSKIAEGELSKEDREVPETKCGGDCPKDNIETALFKPNDKPQDEGPTGVARNKVSHDENPQMTQTKANEISSAIIELNAVNGIHLSENEGKDFDVTLKNSGFDAGVDSIPPTSESTIQTVAADLTEQALIEKKKKKRGPLSIHIGLPGSKRKRLTEEGMKIKPRGEISLAPATNNEVGIKKGDAGDSNTVDVDIDPTKLDTTHEKSREGSADSLSDGEIQEVGEKGEEYTTIMEVDPKGVSRHWSLLRKSCFPRYLTDSHCLSVDWISIPMY